MIKVNVLSEENSWSKKIKNKELFFNKICKHFPKKYKFVDKKIAIEHNGVIVTKSNYRKKFLKNNDQVEIVHFIGGG